MKVFILKHSTIKLADKTAKIINDEGIAELTLACNSTVLNFKLGDAIVIVSSLNFMGIDALLFDKFKVTIQPKNCNSDIIKRVNEVSLLAMVRRK